MLPGRLLPLVCIHPLGLRNLDCGSLNLSPYFWHTHQLLTTLQVCNTAFQNIAYNITRILPSTLTIVYW